MIALELRPSFVEGGDSTFLFLELEAGALSGGLFCKLDIVSQVLCSRKWPWRRSHMHSIPLRTCDRMPAHAACWSAVNVSIE